MKNEFKKNYQQRSLVIASKKYIPQVVELEESVLGALLLEQNALAEVIDFLKPQHFSRKQNTLVYEAILNLFNNNIAVDSRTVVNQLRKDDTLAKIGGVAYVLSLTDTVASSSHITTHARIIVEYAIRRMLISLANDVHHSAHDETVKTFDLLDKTEQAIFDVSAANIQKNYVGIDVVITQTVKEMERKRANPGGISGVPAGFIGLDRLTFGWQKSDFIIIAARPGMGKTAFLLTLLRNAAVDYKIPAALFSLEMSAEQLGNRMVSVEANIDNTKIKNGDLSDKEWQYFLQKTVELKKAPMYIDDTASLSLFEFRAKCRRLKSQKNIQVIFVDYLQLMVGGPAQSAGNMEQQIATISRGLKCVAKELNIPIIAASQLSRAVETRGGDKRPQLSDLRYSGSIEQDADQVFFLYRPEYYGLAEDEEGNDTQGLTELILSKNRNGSTGKVLLRFDAPTTKFSDWQVF